MKEELEELIKKTRERIPEFYPNGHHRKIIFTAYDSITKKMLDYIRPKILLSLNPVGSYHFGRLWRMNYCIFASKKLHDKCHNSASMLINDLILRPVGEKYGFLKKAPSEGSPNAKK